MKKLSLLLLISVLATLGCGQTGPLLLPSAEADKSAQEKPKVGNKAVTKESTQPSR